MRNVIRYIFHEINRGPLSTPPQPAQNRKRKNTERERLPPFLHVIPPGGDMISFEGKKKNYEVRRNEEIWDILVFLVGKEVDGR